MQTSRTPLALLEALLRRESWRVSLLMACALTLLITIGAMAGTFRGAENRFEELSFTLLSRPASGQIHVIEMDAASISAIRQWPWPRDHYARVVRELDAAGLVASRRGGGTKVQAVPRDPNRLDQALREHAAAFARAAALLGADDATALTAVADALSRTTVVQPPTDVDP